MRIRTTGLVTYSTGQRRKLAGPNILSLVFYTLICWLVLGPSYFSQNVVPLCSVFSTFIFLQYFVVAREKEKEKAHIRTSTCCVVLPLGRRNIFDPMASASAPAGELAVQLPAPASSLAVPSPAASTAEAVDLSTGAAILEDSSRLLVLLLLVLRPRRVQDSFLSVAVCLYLCIVGSAAAAAVQ